MLGVEPRNLLRLGEGGKGHEAAGHAPTVNIVLLTGLHAVIADHQQTRFAAPAQQTPTDLFSPLLLHLPLTCI